MSGLGTGIKCESINILPQDADPESMRYRTKLRSVLRRVMELERRLGGEKSVASRFSLVWKSLLQGNVGCGPPGFHS